MAEQDSGRPPLPAFHQVEDAEQARMLMDEEVRRFFRPFLARDATVGAAAAAAGCAPSVMLYRVGTFLRAGLLKVVRQQPRAGRALKVYRSTFDAYLIPYTLTPFATLEEAFYAVYDTTARKLARAMARGYRRSGWDGYRLYRNAHGEAWLEGAPDAAQAYDPTAAAGPVGIDFALEVRLTSEEAAVLRAELHAYLQRYAGHEAKGRREGVRTYLFSAALVPAADDAS